MLTITIKNRKTGEEVGLRECAEAHGTTDEKYPRMIIHEDGDVSIGGVMQVKFNQYLYSFTITND